MKIGPHHNTAQQSYREGIGTWLEGRQVWCGASPLALDGRKIATLEAGGQETIVC